MKCFNWKFFYTFKQFFETSSLFRKRSYKIIFVVTFVFLFVCYSFSIVCWCFLIGILLRAINGATVHTQKIGTAQFPKKISSPWYWDKMSKIALTAILRSYLVFKAKSGKGLFFLPWNQFARFACLFCEK